MTIRDELEQILRKQDVYASIPRAELLKIIDGRIASAAAVTNAAAVPKSVQSEPVVVVIETEGGPSEYDAPEEPTAAEPEAEVTKGSEAPSEPTDAPEEPTAAEPEAEAPSEPTDAPAEVIEETKAMIDLSDGVSPEEFAAVVDAVKADAEKLVVNEKKPAGSKKAK